MTVDAARAARDAPKDMAAKPRRALIAREVLRSIGAMLLAPSVDRKRPGPARRGARGRWDGWGRRAGVRAGVRAARGRARGRGGRGTGGRVDAHITKQH